MSDDALAKVPPHNLEAEKSVLGAILVKNETFDLVDEVLAAEDFYLSAHGTIFQAMKALATARQPIDAITLTEALRPRLKEIGGAAYFAELGEHGIAPSLAPHHARIVREKSVQRALRAYGNDIAARAADAPAQWSPEWTEEQLAVAEYSLARIASRAIVKPEPTQAETLATALWKIEHHAEDSIATGIKTLDDVFTGFSAGQLLALAARTSRGKTALATNFALNAAKAGQPVAFFTLEMTQAEMLIRAIGALAKVDMFAARRYGYCNGDGERVKRAEKLLNELPLRIVCRPGMTPRTFRFECRRLARELGGLKLAVIDYLGMMRGDVRERERWREMSEIVVALKAIAAELAIPILLLVQLNREVDEHEKPALACLRDTGTTEEHSDVIFLLWSPKRSADAPPRYDGAEDAELIIAKQRNGPAGKSIELRFKKEHGLFFDA